jgi:hypothetical protein
MRTSIRVNATSDGDNEIVAAKSGVKIQVISYALVVDVAGTVSLQDTAGTPTIHAQFPLAANGGVSYAGDTLSPAFTTDVGTGVEINNPAGTNTFGHLTYVETY